MNIERVKTDIRCDMCLPVTHFSSFDILEQHNLKFHMKKEKDGKLRYKCNYCSKTFTDRHQLSDHISQQHKKRSECKRIYPNKKSLDAHIEANDKKENAKHVIEKEPSLQNHKKPQNILDNV